MKDNLWQLVVEADAASRLAALYAEKNSTKAEKYSKLSKDIFSALRTVGISPYSIKFPDNFKNGG